MPAPRRGSGSGPGADASGYSGAPTSGGSSRDASYDDMLASLDDLHHYHQQSHPHPHASPSSSHRAASNQGGRSGGSHTSPPSHPGLLSPRSAYGRGTTTTSGGGGGGASSSSSSFRATDPRRAHLPAAIGDDGRSESSTMVASDDRVRHPIGDDRIRHPIGEGPADPLASPATAPGQPSAGAASNLSKGRALERQLLAESSNAELQAALAPMDPIDERLIVPEYVTALCQVLHADKAVSPTPDDFLTDDGWRRWQDQVNGRLQHVIADLLRLCYVDPPPPPPEPSRASRKAAAADDDADAGGGGGGGDGTVVHLQLKVKQAGGLLAKEGKSRDPYCAIEVGPVADDDVAGGHHDSSSAPREIYMTEVIPGTTNPCWNQHLKIQVTNLTDRVV
ncbi:hypothetical protein CAUPRSCDRAFT_11886, partial [Caulochytrium protostelioides]